MNATNRTGHGLGRETWDRIGREAVLTCVIIDRFVIMNDVRGVARGVAYGIGDVGAITCKARRQGATGVAVAITVGNGLSVA